MWVDQLIIFYKVCFLIKILYVQQFILLLMRTLRPSNTIHSPKKYYHQELSSIDFSSHIITYFNLTTNYLEFPLSHIAISASKSVHMHGCMYLYLNKGLFVCLTHLSSAIIKPNCGNTNQKFCIYEPCVYSIYLSS